MATTSTFGIRQGALVLFVILAQRGGDAHKVNYGMIKV
jgi:hypothetical protein